MKIKSLICLLVIGAPLCATHQASAKTMSDTLFAKKAAAGGLTEVELGKLAQQNGDSQAVKDFGAKMVDDHSKANDALKAVAAKNNLTIPDKPTADQQEVIDTLSKKSGAAFDKSYIRTMVSAHIKDKALFAAESENGKNPDLKQFATDTLPVIKGHLAMIEDIASGKSASGMDMKSTNVGSAAESKSGVGPGGNANPVTTPSSDAGTGMPDSAPGGISAGQGKSGAAPGGNANSNPQ